MIPYINLSYKLVEGVLFSLCNDSDLIRFQIFDKTRQLQLTGDLLHRVTVSNPLNLALCNDHCSFHTTPPPSDFVSYRVFMSRLDLLDLAGLQYVTIAR